jgi:hypothetical protein
MILALKGKLTYAQAEVRERACAHRARGRRRGTAGMGFDRKAACDAVDELASELASGGADGIPRLRERAL